MKSLLINLFAIIFLFGLGHGENATTGKVEPASKEEVTESVSAKTAESEESSDATADAAKTAEVLAAEEAAAKKKAEENAVWVKIDLSEQKAYLYREGTVIKTSPISSGKSSRPTPKGSYKVTEKDKWHRSGWYGSYVSKRTGRVVRSNVDSRKSKAPWGSVYRGASMFYFLRFNGPIGMHAGHLPGYPASHGCVRLPLSNAKIFYNYCSLGTKVVVQQ